MSKFWKCPECGAVFEAEYLDVERECEECNERVSPSSNAVYWAEFADYCRMLKNGE